MTTAATPYLLYLVFALGAAGLYFLLPRRGPSKSTIAALFGVSAILGLLVLIAGRGSLAGDRPLTFYLFTAMAILAAARVITHSKPVYSAIYFVALVIAVAALLLLQEAEFLAVALVIIYAGAILVTYLFVIMLAQQPESPTYDRRAREPFLAVVVGFIFVASITGSLNGVTAPAPQKTLLTNGGPNTHSTPSPSTGNTMAIGATLMTRNVVALELSGILLLISMVGAIALSRKRITSQRLPIALGQIGKEVEPF